MADKFYHQQPCFCIPCRVLRDSGEKLPSAAIMSSDEKQKKPKAKRGKKS